jgi:hypothetical protein
MVASLQENFALEKFTYPRDELEETYNATREIGRMPDQLGKNRKHWDNLHMKIQLRLLRAQLVAQRAKKA